MTTKVQNKEFPNLTSEQRKELKKCLYVLRAKNMPVSKAAISQCCNTAILDDNLIDTFDIPQDSSIQSQIDYFADKEFALTVDKIVGTDGDIYYSPDKTISAAVVKKELEKVLAEIEKNGKPVSKTAIAYYCDTKTTILNGNVVASFDIPKTEAPRHQAEYKANQLLKALIAQLA